MDFKVRCTKSAPNTTLGKIYEVKGGAFTFDDGQIVTDQYNFETLCEGMESKFDLVPDRPRICEVLGNEKPLEIDEIFKFSEKGSDCRINSEGRIEYKRYSGEWSDMANQEELQNAINHPEKIIRTPQFSEDEKALMRLYVAAGYPIFKPNAFDPYITAWEKSEVHGRALPDGLLLQIVKPFNVAEYLEAQK